MAAQQIITGAFQIFWSLDSPSLFFNAALGIVKTNLERIVHRLDLKNPLNVKHVDIRLNLIMDTTGPIKFSSINANQANKALTYLCDLCVKYSYLQCLQCQFFISGNWSPAPVQIDAIKKKKKKSCPANAWSHCNSSARNTNEIKNQMVMA